MHNPPPATLRLTVDTDALAANWRALAALAGEASRVKTGAAVKANCYGLGVDACVPVLRDAGAAAFFVAHWSEVPAVLQHVSAEHIIVLHGPGTADEAAYARAIGVKPVINSILQAKLWIATGAGPCHLMVDTGINRLGVGPHGLSDPAIQGLDIGILLSHLASADEASPMNAQQLRAFQTCQEQVRHQQLSLCNSAGIALGSAYHHDLLRPGLALYGGVPCPELADVIRQVAFPQAAIIQKRQLRAGDSVGYNAAFTAQHDMPAAVVSLGYADGFLRCWGAHGFLRNAGRDLPILGKVSMDMVVVDLTAAPELAEGDWLDLPYHLPDASRLSGLSQYELLTILGQRFQK